MKILKFTAPWCGACVSLDKEINSMKRNLDIQEINTDDNPELVKKYGITVIPTFVFLTDSGDVKAKHIHIRTAIQLAEALAEE